MKEKQYLIVHHSGYMYVVESYGGGNVYLRVKSPAGTILGCLVEAISTGLDGLYGFAMHDLKTIATNNPLLGLPLLPEIKENVELLAEESYTLCHGCDENDKNFWTNGYMHGYNANSDKQYTEEDMLKYIEHRMVIWRKLIKESIASGEYKTIENPFEWLEARVHKAAIEALNPKPTAVVLEMERTRLPKGDDGWEDIYTLKVNEKGFVNVLKWVYEKDK